MPLWAWAYLLVIALLSVYAVYDDVREGKARVYAVIDVLAVVALAALFVAHFQPGLAARIGRLGVPLFLGGFLWTTIRATREIGTIVEDPELSPRVNLIVEHIGLALGVLLFSPLIAYAALAAMRSW